MISYLPKLALFTVCVSLGVYLRVWSLPQLSASIDSVHFEETALQVRNGINIYSASANYNYPPLFAWILAILPSPFQVSFRLLLAGCDSLIAWGLWRMTQSRLYALLYWFNPVLILSIRLAGQFDIIAIGCIVYAYFACARSRV
jgi:hypothetical protein